MAELAWVPGRGLVDAASVAPEICGAGEVVAPEICGARTKGFREDSGALAPSGTDGGHRPRPDSTHTRGGARSPAIASEATPEASSVHDGGAGQAAALAPFPPAVASACRSDAEVLQSNTRVSGDGCGPLTVGVRRVGWVGTQRNERPLVAFKLQAEPVAHERYPVSRAEVWDWSASYKCGVSYKSVQLRGGGTRRELFTCQSAGCYRCDRRRHRRTASPASWLVSPHPWHLVTLTWGERVATAEAFVAVREALTALIRSARRGGMWEGGAYFFECVPWQWSERDAERGECEPDSVGTIRGYSEIPCPVCNGPCPDHTEGALWWRRAQAGLCALCFGHGVLPLGHVHAHLLTTGPSVWFTREAARKGALRGVARALCPDGLPFLEWCARFGWGRCSDDLVNRDAAAAYASKAVSSYASKGASGPWLAWYQQAYLRGLGTAHRWAARFGAFRGRGVKLRDLDRTAEVSVTEHDAVLAAVLDVCGAEAAAAPFVVTAGAGQDISLSCVSKPDTPPSGGSAEPGGVVASTTSVAAGLRWGGVLDAAPTLGWCEPCVSIAGRWAVAGAGGRWSCVESLAEELDGLASALAGACSLVAVVRAAVGFARVAGDAEAAASWVRSRDDVGAWAAAWAFASGGAVATVAQAAALARSVAVFCLSTGEDTLSSLRAVGWPFVLPGDVERATFGG